jgi:hypothetical protein
MRGHGVAATKIGNIALERRFGNRRDQWVHRSFLASATGHFVVQSDYAAKPRFG